MSDPKWEALDAVDADVVVLQELSGTDVAGDEFTWVMKHPYAGAPHSIAVRARAPWVVTQHPVDESYPGWALVARVTGPRNFTLVAVHANPKVGAPESYTGQLQHVASELLPSLVGDVVVAGDFNAPVPSTLRRHVANDAMLQSHGLVSAYLTSRGLRAEDAYANSAAGALGEPTYFHRRHPGNGFHLDHVYVPVGWGVGLADVTVGSPLTWMAAGLSDHVPITVDLDFNGIPELDLR
jgi:endonuclease/exonuclease/phosphatase (EEP) superfamily protein YafD